MATQHKTGTKVGSLRTCRILCSLTALSLITGAGSLSASASADEAPPSVEASPPMGWLFSTLNEGDIKLSGWLQSSYADGNRGDQLLPATFFRKESGFSLDQFGLLIEKKVKSNILSRVGPFPGEAPRQFDWGFNVTASYGADNFFFRTFGVDDDWGTNRVGDFDNSDYYLTLTQAYVDLYFPVLGGSTLMVGLFHTPLANEIGFSLPAPAPTDFYTHPYSFMHGPAKHVGALWSSQLKSEPGQSMISYEIGVVRGWNNFEDPNSDVDIIANLRWRSADFSLWIDFENIIGNGADDSFAECGCGSPIPTSSELAGDDSLTRHLSYLTVTKFIDPNNRVVAELSYGKQEKSLFADLFNIGEFGVPENGGVDAKWYGINVSYLHKFNGALTAGTRAEVFKTDGVHVVLPYEGTYKNITANLTWTPAHYVRVRPEIRYDWHSGKSAPFGADDSVPKAPPLLFGNYHSQLSYSLDVTFFY